jgi:hypothetical protein
VGLLDADQQPLPSPLPRYLIGGVIFVLLMTVAVAWMLRFHSEKKLVDSFFQAVVAGEYQKAYDIWKPPARYTMEDFLDDWGEKGFYGPVKSYQIVTAQRPRGGGSGIIVAVEVSPYERFPEDSDQAKHRYTKEVRIWVEKSDLSLGFAP